MGLTTMQERALVIVPKITASFGMPCNLFIIHELYIDRKRGKGSTIHRAILGMCCIDILSSSAWFLSSWAVPRGTYAFAAGNRASCNYQGFLLQLAIGAPMYNCSLALYYLLVVKYGWTDDMLYDVEKYVHALILFFSVSTSVALLPLEQYNQVGNVCYIIGDPVDCDSSSFRSSQVPCERGKHAWIYGTTLFYGPLWICIVACCFSMVSLYRQVSRTRGRIRRYGINGTSTSSLGRRDSSRVAMQAILYTLSFYITWTPSTLWSIGNWLNWRNKFWLDLAAAVAEPLQGLWNMLVFARQRTGTRRKLTNALSFILPCFFTRHSFDSDPSRGVSRHGVQAIEISPGRPVALWSNVDCISVDDQTTLDASRRSQATSLPPLQIENSFVDSKRALRNSQIKKGPAESGLSESDNRSKEQEVLTAESQDNAAAQNPDRCPTAEESYC